MLWGLRPGPPRRFALGLAVALGSLWFVLFAVYASLFAKRLFHAEPVQYWGSGILLLLAGATLVPALLQGTSAILALKVYRSVLSGRDRLLGPVGPIVMGLVCGVLLIFAVAAIWSRDQAGQFPAVGSLRTINTAEITYDATYGRGYTLSLAELAPPTEGMQPSASAAGLISSALASGTKPFKSYRIADDIVEATSFALGRGRKFAYRYDYQPGPRDEQGRIQRYTICARPVDTTLGWNSYFTDETGVIRVTHEDRCPTPQDWPVAG